MANTTNTNVYGISNFIPGQVWWLHIDTEELDTHYTKKYPYLIIAANNRRIVVLRMTHGGLNGTNWLYHIDMNDDDDKSWNIICDAPITLSVKKIREKEQVLFAKIGPIDPKELEKVPRYDYTFSPDMFNDILKYYLAAMIHQSVPEIIEGDDYNDICNLVKNHKDRIRAFSKYKLTFENDAEVEEEVSNDILEELDEEEEFEEDIQETEVTTKDDTIIEPKVEIAKAKFDEDGKIIDINPLVEEVEVKEKPHAEKTEWPEIEASDCFIFQAGFRTRDVEVIEDLTRVGVKNPKFAMAHLINTHKVSYVNNRYNVTLKSTLIDRKHPAKTWMKNIISDIERLGIKNTALIWGKHYNYIWRLYDEYKASKLPTTISNVDVKGA